MNQSALHTLQPYEGIIRFVVAMLAANYFWKFTVLGDEHGYGAVTWFGMDLTWYFNQMADHIAGVVYTMLSWFDSTVTLTNGNHLRFVSAGIGTSIVWGCTGIKQSFIWLIIMLAARGRWLDKLWYTGRMAVCIRFQYIPDIYGSAAHPQSPRVVRTAAYVPVQIHVLRYVLPAVVVL